MSDCCIVCSNNSLGRGTVMVWQAYTCPFGCGATHQETLASEAMAFWYGVHECKNEEDSDG